MVIEHIIIHRLKKNFVCMVFCFVLQTSMLQLIYIFFIYLFILKLQDPNTWTVQVGQCPSSRVK